MIASRAAAAAKQPLKIWIEESRSAYCEDPENVTELVSAFAERHVLLTPSLAEALDGLERHDAPMEAPVWGAGYRLAGRAVGQEGVLGKGRFWRGAFSAFITTVAEPVLRMAMRRVGRVGLPGAAPLEADDRIVRLHSHALFEARMRSFDAEVENLLSDENGMGRGFWIEVAVRLLGAASRDAELRAGHAARRLGIRTVIPEPDPLLCRLLFQSEPILPDNLPRTRRRRSSMAITRRRSGVLPKEAGVRGIRSSTRPEDLPDALFTELIPPPQIVADRLLHEGMLVRHRPPFLHRPRRHILAMGIADMRSGSRENRETRDGEESLALVKAAWADAAIRLQLLLSIMGLDRSDLVWSERNEVGYAAHHLNVEGIEVPERLDPFALSASLRASRLYKSSLMPGFVDTLAGAGKSGAENERGNRGIVARLCEYGLRRAAIRFRTTLRRRRYWDAAPPRSADYARRIAIIVLGADSMQAGSAVDDRAGMMGELRTILRPALDDVRILALIAPPSMMPGASFAVLGDINFLPDGRGEVAVDPDAAPAEAIGMALGELSALMIRTVLEASDGC